MKRVLVSGYIGFNNFGDEAIFYALSNHLKSLGIEVSVLCNNKKEVKKKYAVKTYNFKKPFQILKAILNCDILISGGGSLLQNKTSNFSLFYYLFIILLAKICFKKTIIFAQGIEPIRGIFQAFLTKTVLKTANYITVRDKNSLELLKSWKIDANLVSDPVYSIVQDEKIAENKEGLIVQLRNFKGIEEKFLDDLSDVISKNFKEKINVFSFQDEIDEKICLNFTQKLKSKGLDAKYTPAKPIEETIQIVNNTKFMISTRLHGVLISNALETKTFALIYDEKIKTISDELKIENIDIFNYKKEELDEKIEKFFNNETQKVPFRRFFWDCIDNILEN